MSTDYQTNDQSTLSIRNQLNELGQTLASGFIARHSGGVATEKNERIEVCLALTHQLCAQPQSAFAFFWATSQWLEYFGKVKKNNDDLQQTKVQVIAAMRELGLTAPAPKIKETIEFTEDENGNITGARVFEPATLIHASASKPRQQPPEAGHNP